MKTVQKFDLAHQIGQPFTIAIPKGAMVLDVQMQNGTPKFWALVDDALDVENRTFVMYGTGKPVEETNISYIGTFQVQSGMLVWHLFEVK